MSQWMRKDQVDDHISSEDSSDEVGDEVDQGHGRYFYGGNDKWMQMVYCLIYVTQVSDTVCTNHSNLMYHNIIPLNMV